MNAGNWASKQKKIYTAPSSQWHSLAQWFVPKYKISWKAITAPNGESYIILPTNSIFLLARSVNSRPTWSPGHLGLWLKPRHSAGKRRGTIQSCGLWRGLSKCRQLCYSFHTHPQDLPCSLTGGSQLYCLPASAKNLSFCSTFLAKRTQYGSLLVRDTLGWDCLYWIRMSCTAYSQFYGLGVYIFYPNFS